MARIQVIIALATLATATSIALGQTWELGPALPDPTPRIYAVGVNFHGTIYAIGGTPWQNGGDMDGSVHYLASDATSWVAASPLSGMGPIISHGAGVDALDRIVVFGGFISNDDGPGDDIVYEPIDGPTGGVAHRPAPETATGYMAFAFDDQNRLYGIGGGPGTGGPNSTYVDRYDATTDSWETLAALPTGIADACAVYDGNGHIFVCGGIDASGTARTANVIRYDIVTNSWSDVAIPDLPEAISGAEASLGADGRIYVVGGETGGLGAGTTKSSVYTWESSTDTWVVTASMNTPRKNFALVLGNDDYLYAIGGDNDSGGTNMVERLFTPRCPSFDQHPTDQTAWSGSIAGFSTSVSGAGPFNFQWQRNGQLIVDGPTGSGSEISGTTTATLTILNPGQDDQAAYHVVVSNDCGSTTSNIASLTVQQTPSIPTRWKVTSIHPAWAQDSSSANGIANGRIGGSATTPTLLPDGRTLTLDHPVVWEDTNSPGFDVTPGNSIGGAIRDVAGELFVGWYWHIYNCPPPTSGTCGWQSAAFWTGDNLAFTEAVHSSGPEFDYCHGTDGVGIAGTLTYEFTEGNYQSRATMWIPPGSAINLHNSSLAAQSGANAIDGQYQYGSFNSAPPGPITHAARWAGNAASMTDIHPSGFSRSWVSGAGDGHAVGTAILGSTSHAILWAGGSAFVDLTPNGMSAEAVDASNGLQIGTVSGHPAIWAGNKNSFVDLSAVLPAEFTAGRSEALEIGSDGNIIIVGSAYVPARGRREAIVWESMTDPLLGDANCDGVVNLNDIAPFTEVILLIDTAPCHVAASDMNADGYTNGNDIALFVSAILGI